MKLLTLTILFTIVALSVTQNLRQQHKFNPLESLDPMQTIQLMSGDWTAILPESVRGIARTLLGKQQQSGPMDMLSKAQGLLGGGSSSNGLGSLLGGLTGGNANQSGSGSSVSSLLGKFSGLLGDNGASGSSSSTSSSILGGVSNLLGGNGSSSSSSSSTSNSFLGGVSNLIGGNGSGSGSSSSSSSGSSNPLSGLTSSLGGFLSHKSKQSQ